MTVSSKWGSLAGMNWKDVNERAARANGMVELRQVGEVEGISRRTVERRAEREGWVRPQRAVVALPGAPLDFAGLSRAAVLAAGDRAMVGGLAALHLAGLDVDRTGRGAPPLAIDVVIPIDRGIRLQPPARTRRSRTLLADDEVQVQGIRATRLERALLDTCAWHGPGVAVPLLLDAVQRRLTTADRVRARAERRSPIRGRSQLLRACDAVDDGIQSTFEARIPPLLARAGLPMPTAQCPVLLGGRTIHLDFGWPELRVGIECMGLRPHNDRDALRRDLRRLNRMRGGDWRIIWVEWSRLISDPDGLVAEIADELRRATVRL